MNGPPASMAAFRLAAAKALEACRLRASTVAIRLSKPEIVSLMAAMPSCALAAVACASLAALAAASALDWAAFAASCAALAVWPA